MIYDNDAQSPQSKRWSDPAARPSSRWRQPEKGLTRFLGGTPINVVIRLFFLSLIVGALLNWLDISPTTIVHAVTRFVDHIWGLGFDAVRELGEYLLAGALIVVPIWLVLRLLTMRAPR